SRLALLNDPTSLPDGKGASAIILEINAGHPGRQPPTRQRRGFGLAKTSLSGTIPTVRYRGFLPFGRQFWVGGNCDCGGVNSGDGFRVVGQEPGERGRPAHREGGGPAVRGAGLRRDAGAGDRRGGRGDEADPVLPLREQGGPGAGARDRTPD